jgi:hypothetical protein
MPLPAGPAPLSQGFATYLNKESKNVLSFLKAEDTGALWVGIGSQWSFYGSGFERSSRCGY